MKIFTGTVVSKKMQKTATIAVERIVAHPVYKKRVRRIKKYHVHDVLGVEVGQVVKFVASKPFSKTKKWKIIEVVDKGKASKSVKARAGKVVDRKGKSLRAPKKTENTEKKRKSARRKKKEAEK